MNDYGASDVADQGDQAMEPNYLKFDSLSLHALFLFALTQPPVVHELADRITPWVLGMPFLYAWLLGVYVLLIGVLVWGMRRGL